MQTKQLSSFFFFVIFIMFMAGCASKAAIKKPEQTSASPPETMQVKTQPAPQPELENIEIRSANQGCSIRLSTTVATPTYTVFKLTKPERIIVDLPDMLPNENYRILEVQNDFITHIKSTQIQDKGESFLRVEVGLQNDYSYNAEHKNNSIFIALSPKTIAGPKIETPKAAEAKADPTPEKISASQTAAKKVCIKDIKISQTAAGHNIAIVADSEIEKYHSYSLQKPNRLTIDLPGAKSLLKKPAYTVGGSLIEKVRVGQKPDQVRIVIDLKGDKFPLYQIAQGKNYLNVSIRAEKKAASATEPEDNKLARDIADEEKTPEAENPAEEPGPDDEKYTGEKISLDFKDADIKNVLRLISDISGLNMIVGENVQGKITMKLENIPWDEALDIILETNNAGKLVTRNVVRIETNEQIRRMNEEKRQAQKSQESVEALVVKTLDVSYAKAQNLAKFIKKMKVLSPRGSVTEFKLTNKITVQDISENVRKIEILIKEQDIPTRQVLIESRIIQSNPTWVKELGIKWGGTYNTTHNNDLVTLNGALGDNNVVDLAGPANGALGFGYLTDNFNLDMTLTAMENDDKIKIVSSPKVLALDNKEARIKQGVALPYLKLSEEGVTSTEFKDMVLELEVTPKITPANTIALHVFVTKNQPSAQKGANNEPGIDVREVETDLLVESGKTIVIGGIYENQTQHVIHKVPVFGDIPYLGFFFRNEKEEEQLTELLVFITVTIIDNPQNIAQNVSEVSG